MRSTGGCSRPWGIWGDAGPRGGADPPSRRGAARPRLRAGLAPELPERPRALMTVGVGGYVVGRSAERGVDPRRKGGG